MLLVYYIIDYLVLLIHFNNIIVLYGGKVDQFEMVPSLEDVTKNGVKFL